MELVKLSDTYIKKNGANCDVLEYPFKNGLMDLGIATIRGKYPLDGYVSNLESSMLVYVLEGSVILHFRNREVNLSKGDSIMISPLEEYYWDSLDMGKIVMVCNPAFDPDKYKLTK